MVALLGTLGIALLLYRLLVWPFVVRRRIAALRRELAELTAETRALRILAAGGGPTGGERVPIRRVLGGNVVSFDRKGPRSWTA